MPANIGIIAGQVDACPARVLNACQRGSSVNPSPASPVAETMRQLLPKGPDLSFDELRDLARAKLTKR